MIQLLAKHALLAAARLLLLCVVIFLILRSGGELYDRDLSFVEFFQAMFSGRLVRAPGLTGLPPLPTAFLYSLTTLTGALLLSYGFGGPLGVVLGGYQDALGADPRGTW